MDDQSFANLSASGAHLHEFLLNALTEPNYRKTLPEFGISRLSQLVGVSTQHIRNLEKAGTLPAPRTVKSGALNRRVYSLADADRIRKILNIQVSRPAGSRALRVSFSNLKGGVGKSTCSVYFAQYAARAGYRVLLVDMDPQASATSVFGYVPDLHLVENDTIYDALMEDPYSIQDKIRETYWHKLSLVPAMMDLQNADFMLPIAEENNHETMGTAIFRLRQAIEVVRDDYDIIVIDTPPSMGMLCFNTFMSADYIIAPFTPHMFDLASSVQFFRMLATVMQHDPDHPLRKMSILVNRHDHSVEARRTHQMLLQTFGNYVLANYVRQTIEVHKASSDLLSVYEIDEVRGSMEAHRNAIRMFDAVNEEILTNIRMLWQEELHAVEQQRIEA
ncbi:chromosome partitioning protein [Natronocella acetinitrilica]|uniref:Chromosome partitioning protein n=1 Tax=Natronocella acetinitrilica TaxID=414046 RepID=A0AAE3G2W4_9GAMM|nr:AAA family ATPase [Natronocella acetinitrilica]MCP1674168.1 chromosome partitioning protein [Natronocella acetinitrilica]